MNRIILVGNGFDLAHQMKTSYKDFIDNYWETLLPNITAEIIKDNFPMSYESSDLIIRFQYNYNLSPAAYSFTDYDDFIKRDGVHYSLQFENQFLEIISRKNNIQNWVDVENEYYEILKEIFKLPNATGFNIKKLNSDFKKIEIALKKYLKKVEEDHFSTIKPAFPNINKQIREHLCSRFHLDNFTETHINKTVERTLKNITDNYSKNSSDQEIFQVLQSSSKNRFKHLKEILTDRESFYKFNFYPDNVLIVNFNYTHTEEHYPKFFENRYTNTAIPITTIHIHGELDASVSRDIIFGYGDEMDENYKGIENLNDNDFLTNVKSIRYLENDNYKKLLEFINSDDYQVFIFGHSCGISDRTLLNTIFEHNNCGSIKPFYHKKSDTEDNYTEIVKNISRNFNSKIKMRDVVVNKEYCQPLIF